MAGYNELEKAMLSKAFAELKKIDLSPKGEGGPLFGITPEQLKEAEKALQTDRGLRNANKGASYVLYCALVELTTRAIAGNPSVLGEFTPQQVKRLRGRFMHRRGFKLYDPLGNPIN